MTTTDPQWAAHIARCRATLGMPATASPAEVLAEAQRRAEDRTRAAMASYYDELDTPAEPQATQRADSDVARFAAMSPAERAALRQADPVTYTRLRDTWRAWLSEDAARFAREQL